METEAKIILAFLYTRSGKTMLKESEIYLPLSMELGWFSTKEAQDFIKYAKAKKLLEETKGVLHPTFAVETIAIPIGFAPSKKEFIIKEKKEPIQLLDLLIIRLSEQTGQERSKIAQQIQQLNTEKHITPEVAALLLATIYHVPMTEFYDDIEKTFVHKK